jgi:hypothetical protein
MTANISIKCQFSDFGYTECFISYCSAECHYPECHDAAKGADQALYLVLFTIGIEKRYFG